MSMGYSAQDEEIRGSAEQSDEAEQTEEPVINGTKVKRQRYRSSLTTTFRIFKELSSYIRDEHKAVMKYTPFYHFWKPFYENNVIQTHILKSDQVIEAIIANFDPDEMTFRVGTGHLKPTARDLELIFGVTSGKKKLIVKTIAKKPDIGLLNRRAMMKTNTHLSLYDISKELPSLVRLKTKESVYDFVKLLTLHTILTLFECKGEAKIKNGLVVIVDEIEKLGDYAWAEYFMEGLLTSLKKNYKNLSAIGCVAIIPYLLCEHTKVVQPKIPDAMPRFCKWKLEDLTKYLNHKCSIEQVPLSKIRLGTLDLTCLSTLDLTFDETFKYGVQEENREDAVLYLKCNKSEVIEFQEKKEKKIDDREGVIRNLKITNAGLRKKVSVSEVRIEKGKRRIVDLGKNLVERKRGREAAEIRTLKELCGRVETEERIEVLEKELEDATRSNSTERTSGQSVKRKLNKELLNKMSTFTPGLTQKIYTIDDELDFDEEEVTLPYKPLKIPAEFLPTQEMLRLQTLYHVTKGANEVYWSSPSLELHLRDITPIFTKAFTSANLIDAWAYFMMKDQESAGQGSRDRQIIGEENSDMSGKSCFVTSMIWTFVKSLSNTKIDTILKNQAIKVQNDVRFIHFPMSSPGFANSSKFDTPNHWTLLVFDKHTNIWRFYNSLRPRTKDSKDYYFDEAMAVVKHAHKVMNEWQRSESANSSTLPERPRVERVIDSPRQGDSTVDCGYIVMKIMECYAHNKPIPEQWTAKQMKEFKRDLLLRIVNDEHAVKSEDYLKDKAAQLLETEETSEDVIFLKMVSTR